MLYFPHYGEGLYMIFIIAFLILLILITFHKVNKLKESLSKQHNELQDVVSEFNRKLDALENKTASISKFEYLHRKLKENDEDIELTHYHIRHAIKELQETVFVDSTLEENTSRLKKLFANDQDD